MSSFKTRTEKIVCDTYIFKEKLDNYNNYFTNPSQQSCFVYDKSERLINKSCNLYQILGEIIGILRNACTLSTENRHKTLHGFVIAHCLSVKNIIYMNPYFSPTKLIYIYPLLPQISEQLKILGPKFSMVSMY